MIDSKAKRAAALGYGLSFLLVCPPASGSLSIPDAGHALNAYRYDMPALTVLSICDTGVVSLNPTRIVASLNPARAVASLNPTRAVTAVCG